MKITIIGNIGSGKSSLIAELIKTNSIQSSLSIDQIRKKIGDGTIEGENKCKLVFVDSINVNHQIIELSGVGILGEKTFQKLETLAIPSLVVYLKVSSSIIEKRIQKRNWDIPFPVGVENIPNAIKYTSEKFDGGLLQSLYDFHKSGVYLTVRNHNMIDFKKNIKIINSIISVMKEYE